MAAMANGPDTMPLTQPEQDNQSPGLTLSEALTNAAALDCLIHNISAEDVATMQADERNKEVFRDAAVKVEGYVATKRAEGVGGRGEAVVPFAAANALVLQLVINFWKHGASGKTSSYKKLQAKLLEARTALAEAQEVVATHETEVQALLTELDETQDDRDTIQDDLNTTQDELNTTQEMLAVTEEAHQAKLDELQTKLDVAQGEVETLSASNEELQAERDKLAAELKMVNEEGGTTATPVVLSPVNPDGDGAD